MPPAIPPIIANPPGIAFVYRATIERVVDGDTVFASIDLGFNVWHKNKFRLAHINAPERATPEGPAATKYLFDWVAKQKTLTFFSKGLDKYGRWVAVIWGDDSTKSVNQLMIDSGNAVRYM